MAISRDLDGRMILPARRVEALASVLRLREEHEAAGLVPYPQDWPFPQCPECHGNVQRWGGGCGEDGEARSIWFFPCGHGIVADEPMA
ncbi:hypothetical protein ACFVEN_44290 [Streptomyces sp. NPDC057681]|uniref:hypothetical protein n=1 Tax=Streptomyces sp. NPDC057681 TaxID=3346209 RepID=UPI0036743500